MNTPSTTLDPETVGQVCHRQTVDIFVEMLRQELYEDFDERPTGTRSPEEVIGTIEREAMDVKMALFNCNISRFCREHFDLAKKIARSYIDCQRAIISIK